MQSNHQPSEEEEKEFGSGSLEPEVFAPCMPRLQAIAMMEFPIVLYHLQNQRASLYFGMSFETIMTHITKNEAYRYLCELAILNEAQKQPLD